MPDDASSPKRVELFEQLAQTKVEAERIEALGKTIASGARSIRDFADVVEEIYRSSADDVDEFADVGRLAESWRSVNSALRAFSPSFTAVSVTAAAATNSTLSELWHVDGPLTWRSPDSESAKDRLLELQQHPELMAELHAGMQRLQLDLDSPWSRTPTDLLNEAERALLLPVIGDGGPTSTLLTIRECIDGAISGLIPRRPTQEPAKSWGQKLSSIARQCGHPDIAVDVVEHLAEDVGMLMNELSGAKQRPLTRREISRLFYRAAWFLKTFLGLIDEHRLKPLGGQR